VLIDRLRIKYLIEVKAIGLTLKDNHLRQAIGYGAAEGIPWVLLTNGVDWEIHKIRFEKPVTTDLVCTFNFLDLSPRDAADQDKLFLLCKEGLSKAAIEEYHTKVRSLNRFVIAALMQSDSVLTVLRRELRKMTPGAPITTEEISEMLPEVLKRDVLEGDAAKRAKTKVKKAVAKFWTVRSSPQLPGSFLCLDSQRSQLRCEIDPAIDQLFQTLVIA